MTLIIRISGKNFCQTEDGKLLFFTTKRDRNLNLLRFLSLNLHILTRFATIFVDSSDVITFCDQHLSLVLL